jgi:hypothetical protein
MLMNGVKTKLALATPWKHTGGELHSFLTLALPMYPGNNLLTRGMEDWVGSRPCLDGSGEEKISSTVRDLNPGPFRFLLYPL